MTAIAAALLAAESTKKMTSGAKPDTAAFNLLVNVSEHAQSSGHGSSYPQSAMGYEDVRSAFPGEALR